MNRCPITYDPCGEQKYSERGLRMLSRRLRDLEDLPYTAEEQRTEAVRRAAKMSIQGVQPKLSAVLNVARSRFDVVDTGGRYILKPQSHLYTNVPENEDLTMKMAAAASIETPVHGMVWSRDGTLTYFIRRFDRTGRKGKLPVEDFAQLSGKTRETKYQSSMEHVVKIIEGHCTFPLLDKIRLFRCTLFNFLVGNEDMHLKNFSLVTRDGKVELSPAYDLLNTTLAMGNAAEEIALPIGGKRANLTRSILVDYFARERMALNDVIIRDVVTEIATAFPVWLDLIDRSFLKQESRDAYKALIAQRRKVLGV